MLGSRVFGSPQSGAKPHRRILLWPRHVRAPAVGELIPAQHSRPGGSRQQSPQGQPEWRLCHIRQRCRAPAELTREGEPSRSWPGLRRRLPHHPGARWLCAKRARGCVCADGPTLIIPRLWPASVPTDGWCCIIIWERLSLVPFLHACRHLHKYLFDQSLVRA